MRRASEGGRAVIVTPVIGGLVRIDAMAVGACVRARGSDAGRRPHPERRGDGRAGVQMIETLETVDELRMPAPPLADADPDPACQGDQQEQRGPASSP